MVSTIPLRAKYPGVYQRLTEKMENAGLHVFDVKADVLIEFEVSQEKLSIKFGEHYANERLLTIEQNKVETRLEADEIVRKFLDEAVEACKQQAVEDYHAFMDIQPVKRK